MVWPTGVLGWCPDQCRRVRLGRVTVPERNRVEVGDGVTLDSEVGESPCVGLVAVERVFFVHALILACGVEGGGVTTGVDEPCCEVGDLGRDLIPCLSAFFLDQYVHAEVVEVIVG